MASTAVGEGPGGKVSTFLDGVAAFVVAIFQPIFHVLVSVISPSNQRTRDQQNHQNTPSQQQNDKDQTTNHHDASASTTSHEGDVTSTPGSHCDHDPKRMAPPLQKQPSAGNRSHQPMPMDEVTNSQVATKAAVPGLDSVTTAVKQENVPTNAKGGHSTNRDLANATTNGQKYRAVGDEQAHENRQEQLTLPPPICKPETAQDIAGGGDVEPEDPATAAERAIHHGFMNQALDMVCHFC